MRIATDYIGKILESTLNPTRKTSNEKTTTSLSGKDRATFSSRAADIDKALSIINTMPEIREDKVEQLRQQIAAGEFRISSDEIADKILNEAQLEKIIGS